MEGAYRSGAAEERLAQVAVSLVGQPGSRAGFVISEDGTDDGLHVATRAAGDGIRVVVKHPGDAIHVTGAGGAADEALNESPGDEGANVGVIEDVIEGHLQIAGGAWRIVGGDNDAVEQWLLVDRVLRVRWKHRRVISVLIGIGPDGGVRRVRGAELID